MKRTVATALILLCTAALGAQTPDYRSELGNARAMERAGNNAEALAVYEKIFKEHPEYQPVFQYLKAAYVKAGMYERLVEACTVAVKLRPKDTSLYMALGEAWAAQGNSKKALESWERIIAIDPANRGHYSLVGYELSMHGMHEEEIGLYERGEKALGENAFARELSRAYERAGDFGKAADEALDMLDLNPKDILGVERELKRLMTRSDGSVILEVVRSRLRRQPEKPLVHRLLGDLYLLRGEYAEALKEYSRSDAEEPLWELARKAEQEGIHDAALDSYRNLAERKGPYGARARFRMAAVLEASGRHGEAVESYKAFLHDFPGDTQAPGARFRIGVALLQGLSDPAGALVYFESLDQDGVPAATRMDSKFMALECNLSLGNLGEALRRADELVPASRSDRALFLLGEALYFKGDFDSARVVYDRVSNEYSESDYVNDALARSVFMADAGRDTALLERYASGERLLRYSRDYDGAMSAFKSLLNDAPEANLADDCAFSIASALEGKKNYNEAVAALRDLITLYPKSPLRPDAQKRIGELFADRLGNRKAAIDELEKVLLDYPDYVLAGAVRNRIEELRVRPEE